MDRGLVMASSFSIEIKQNSQNIENNSSNVTVKVIFWASESWNLENPPGWCKIDGTTYYFNASFKKDTTTTLFEKTLDIYHDDTGKKSLKVEAYFDTKVSIGTYKTDTSKTLTPINRTSKISSSVNEAEIGKTITLYTNRKSTSFTHKLWWTLKGEDFKDEDTAVISGDSLDWQIPDKLIDLITDDATGTLSFQLDTLNGSTKIGSSTLDINIKVPENVVPVVTGVLIEEAVDLVKDNFDGFIQNLSQLLVSVQAEGVRGSTVKSCKTSVNGLSYLGNEFTSGVLNIAGIIKLTAVVTDTRGRNSAPYIVNIPVVEYHTPRIDLQVSTQNDSVDIRLKGEVSPVNGQNTKELALSYRPVDGESYQREIVPLDGYSFDFTINRPLDNEATYEFEATLSDKLNASSDNDITGKIVISRKAGGTGVTFGGPADTDGLVSYWDAVIKGDLLIEGDLNASNFADHTTEIGTEGIWKYKKHKSGYVECYAIVPITVSMNIKWENLYYGNGIPAKELPFPLKEVFYSDAVIRFNNGWTGYSNRKTTPSLTHTEIVYPIGPKALTSEDCFVQYIVKGIIDSGEDEGMTAVWDENGNVIIYGAAATHDGAGNVTIL